MTYNFHTHTKRCGHAKGESENYILRAIENGIKDMGFSEHIPFIFPDGYESYFRLPSGQINEYLDELNFLREKYKDKINIKIGFEMEYYPKYFEAMLENAKKLKAEYLILGQHFLYNEYDVPVSSFAKTSEEARLALYVDQTTEALRTGKYSCFAHPDVINFQGDATVYER